MMFLQNTNSNSNRIIEDATKVKDVTWNSINKILVSIVEQIPLIIAGLIVLLIFWILSKAAKSIFLSASGRTKLDNRLRILFSRLISVVILSIGVLTSLTVFTTLDFGNLIAGLGFTSFVIGFATKDILNNLLSGVLILWQQPFRIGDYLFVGSNQGKVEYIGVRATQLRKDDGELVLIPNGDMYSSAITIRGAGKERRMLLKISIGYDCDVGRAKEIVERVLINTEGVVAEPKPTAVVTDLSSDGVNISIYFWINTDRDKPMNVFDVVATKVKKALDDGGIEMYPPSSVIVQPPPKEPVAAEESGNGRYEKKKTDDF
ncbi:MAG TPA: mechanosensitive ion channel family protein [Pyrinomonadaceae bacterium]|jgi:small-conductance mechanosensitive channel